MCEYYRDFIIINKIYLYRIYLGKVKVLDDGNWYRCLLIIGYLVLIMFILSVNFSRFWVVYIVFRIGVVIENELKMIKCL